MQTYRVETKIKETGRLSLSRLPLRAGDEVEDLVRLLSPRLAHPEDAADFKKEVIESPQGPRR